MIKTTSMLKEELKSYGNPATKIGRMVKAGIYIPIVKGLYETDQTVPGYVLAESIYGPSYLSFEFALSCYGMIPEAVYTFTSAAFEKKKKKKYDTPFGVFTYRDIPGEVFPYGVRIKKEKEYYYKIASPEKALCDKLYTLPPVRNKREFIGLLFEDLRLDEDFLHMLNLDELETLCEMYHSTNLRMFSKVVRGKDI